MHATDSIYEGLVEGCPNQESVDKHLYVPYACFVHLLRFIPREMVPLRDGLASTVYFNAEGIHQNTHNLLCCSNSTMYVCTQALPYVYDRRT